MAKTGKINTNNCYVTHSDKGYTFTRKGIEALMKQLDKEKMESKEYELTIFGRKIISIRYKKL